MNRVAPSPEPGNAGSNGKHHATNGTGAPPRVYEYRDLAWNLVYKGTETAAGIDYRRPGKGGKWAKGLQGVELVPYRLPELAQADPAEPVFICWTEADVELFRSHGLVATCAPAAGRFACTDWESPLTGRAVAVLGRIDDFARESSQGLATVIARWAAVVKVVEPTELRPEMGMADWFADWSDGMIGRGFEGEPGSAAIVLRLLFAKEEPVSPPPGGGEAEAEEKPLEATFRNFREIEGGDGRPTREPIRVHEISATLGTILGPWPKRIDEQLFVQGADFKPVFLETPQRLLALVDRHAAVDWTKGSRFITQERVFEHLRMTSERFDSIEVLPHWPQMPGTFYMHPPVPGPAGLLDRLLDMFSPASQVDRELIKALILTLFWGGAPGSRPAFLFTGEDGDPQQGRGLGKTTLPSLLAEELVGGYIDVSPTDAIADVKTRLLSPSALQMRVARLDNLKTLRLSWADLEGLITSPVISGHALYIGEGRRPNTVMWVITLNGASLSKDMAQRVIVIKVRRPVYDPAWSENVRSFIRDNRPGLLGDIRWALEHPEPGLETGTRWASWEAEVLAATNDPVMSQIAIIERQQTIDNDEDDKAEVADHFAQRLRDYRHDPEKDVVSIPSKVAAEWLSEAERKPWATNAATCHIGGLGITQLMYNRKAGARGWIWRGKKAQASDLASPLGSAAPY